MKQSDTTPCWDGNDPAAIARAAALLHEGGLVALPTETVYGLGANAADDQAVARIFAAKGRPADHPLIIHLAEAKQMSDWAREIPDSAWKLAEHFWPGPLTLILKRLPGVAEAASGGLNTIGLRVPGHPVALALLQALGGGLAAPSANRFGRISPTCADHVLSELSGRIDAVIDGGPCEVGLESTILDLSGPHARVLRPGRITAGELAAVIGPVLSQGTAASPVVPGSLEAHYAPDTPITLVASTELEAETVRRTGQGKVVVLARRPRNMAVGCHWLQLPSEAKAYGHALYARLREADALQASSLLIELPPATPEWEAVNDRLRRSAAGSAKQ